LLQIAAIIFEIEVTGNYVQLFDRPWTISYSSCSGSMSLSCINFRDIAEHISVN